MVNWNGCVGKWAWTFETNVSFFEGRMERTTKYLRNPACLMSEISVQDLQNTKPQGYTLFIKAYWIQSIFVKIKICKFVIKIDLKYTEGEKFVEAAAERGTVVFHPKRWKEKESGECSIMHTFMFCTPHQILVNTCMFMTYS